MLVGAGELVEQRGLAAVLVAGQCEDHVPATSTSIFPASSFRRDREYPRTRSSRGSPRGAIFSMRTLVLGISHIQQAAAQGALAAHGGDDGLLPQGQLVQRHNTFLLKS